MEGERKDCHASAREKKGLINQVKKIVNKGGKTTTPKPKNPLLTGKSRNIPSSTQTAKADEHRRTGRAHYTVGGFYFEETEK